VIHRNPLPTVDVIIESPNGDVLLIRRRNPPYGWALPGGFVDYGETVEQAAAREALEETGLEVSLQRQFHVYSDPSRDPRVHTLSVVFVATAMGTPSAGDDAEDVGFYSRNSLPEKIAFDHRQILEDYFTARF